MKLSLYYPCKPYSLNQDFGNPDPKYLAMGLKGHNGLDLFAPDGVRVRAAHSGTITYAGLDGSNGLLIVLRTNEEYEYEKGTAYFKTLYCHLKTGSIVVHPDDVVHAGDLLALADNTGFSTGSHLHFGLKPVHQGEEEWQWYNLEQDNGYNGAIDPNPYLNGLYADDIDPRFKFTRNLSLYSYGTDVYELQKRLVKDGVADFTPVGVYGPKTRLAVIAFQAKYGIDQTGSVGPITRASLNR